MHAKTLRKYERERFVAPSRTKGRLRLYSAADLARLRRVKQLVEAHGLNLAGVELALLVSRRLRVLRDSARTARLVAELQAQVERDTREPIALLGGASDDEPPVRAEVASASATKSASADSVASGAARRNPNVLHATKE